MDTGDGWCGGGKWLSSAKFAVFQVKRPGMHQQQVAPLWVARVLHDSDSYGFTTTVKERDRRGEGGEGRGKRSWMSVDETVKVRHSKVWEIRRGKWHLRKENPQMMMMRESFRHYFFHYGVKKWGRALLSCKWRPLSYPKCSLSGQITWWTENSREATLTSTLSELKEPLIVTQASLATPKNLNQSQF